MNYENLLPLQTLVLTKER